MFQIPFHSVKQASRLIIRFFACRFEVVIASMHGHETCGKYVYDCGCPVFDARPCGFVKPIRGFSIIQRALQPEQNAVLYGHLMSRRSQKDRKLNRSIFKPYYIRAHIPLKIMLRFARTSLAFCYNHLVCISGTVSQVPLLPVTYYTKTRQTVS